MTIINLIKEDGSVVVGANTYVTRDDDVDEYMFAYGRTEWPGYSNSEQDGFLWRGFLLLERRYGNQWAGSRTGRENVVQLASWPRKGVVDHDGRFNILPDPSEDAPLSTSLDDDKTPYVPSDAIPPEVREAQLEMTWLAAQGVNILPRSVQQLQGPVQTEAVGPIRTTYFHPSGNLSLPALPYLERLLKPYITGGSSSLTPFLTEQEREDLNLP